MELFTTRLNYKSFAKRCTNNKISSFVDMTLKSISNLNFYCKKILLQIDEDCTFKMSYLDSNFPASVRISIPGKLVVDLYKEDIIVEKPKK